MKATLLRPAAWTRSAACAGLATRDCDPFHPSDELNSRAQAAEYAVARRMCADCPVRHPCALEALHGAIAHGMYGGLTPTDRRAIARRFGYPQPGAAQHGSRSCYIAGCRRPECTEAHRRYIAEQRAGRPQRARQPRRRAAFRQGIGAVSDPPRLPATGVGLEVDEAAALPLAVGGMR